MGISANLSSAAPFSLPFKGRVGVGMGPGLANTNPIPRLTSPLKGEEPIKLALMPQWVSFVLTEIRDNLCHPRDPRQGNAVFTITGSTAARDIEIGGVALVDIRLRRPGRRPAEAGDDDVAERFSLVQHIDRTAAIDVLDRVQQVA